MAKILIIEDDEVFSELLVMYMEDRNHEPQTAHTLEQARERLAVSIPDAILLDQQLPDGFGIDILKEIVDQPLHPPVIMITGVSDTKIVIQAMGLGAHDFIRKPVDEIELDTTLTNALKSHRLSRQVSAITHAEDYQVDIGQIIGTSPSILEICKTLGSVASSNAPVLITGESGTGKEVVARALHHHSDRTGLFLPINCSALQASLRPRERFWEESRPRDSHPQPLAERYVNVSAHTAPIKQTHLSSPHASEQTNPGFPSCIGQKTPSHAFYCA